MLKQNRLLCAALAALLILGLLDFIKTGKTPE